MGTPILPLYILGIIFFVLGLEGLGERELKNILYLGLSVFTNLMGYQLSYSDTNYTLSSYLPLALLVLSVLILIYVAFQYIPTGENWDAEDNME